MASASLYTGYTLWMMQLRTHQRRAHNDANKRSQDVVVDSLLNFETVKLFASERPEARRYDGLTQELVRLQTTLQDSLSCMNWGQTVAMQLGVAAGLLAACARTVSSG